MAKSRRSPNNFLASLSPSDFKLLQPHLKLIELQHEAVLFETGASVKNIYFPHSGIISLVVPLSGGQMIEAAMVGLDSIVGASSALDGRISLNKGIVQLPGAASVMSVAPFRKVAEQSETFRTALIHHEQVLFVQAQQSAACNASHKVEARMARWLLRAKDLSSEDYDSAHAGILLADARRPANPCSHYRPQPAEAWPHQLQPGPCSNHQPEGPPQGGVRVLCGRKEPLRPAFEWSALVFYPF